MKIKLIIEKLTLVLFLLPLLFHFSNASTIKQKKEIDVYLIGGQSNATGQGYMRNIPRQYEIDRSVKFYYSKYLRGGAKPESWCELCQASETPDKFGVELSLGTTLKKHFANRDIAIIKHALSGSNLYKQWNPGKRLEYDQNGKLRKIKDEQQGAEYKKWLLTVKTALNKLEDMGYTPKIRAMFWQQGEGDAREIAGMENSRLYGENLRNLILNVREDLDSPNMLFVYGEVMPMSAYRFTGRKLVRNAQIAVSEASCSPLSVKNAFLVEGDDLQMRRTDYRTPYPNDDVHLGTYGLLVLGERFAKVVIDNTSLKGNR